MLLLRCSQRATDNTKNTIKEINNITWLSKRLEKFFLKHVIYKVKGRLATSIPNIIISSVKKLLKYPIEDDFVEKPPVATVVKAWLNASKKIKPA